MVKSPHMATDLAPEEAFSVLRSVEPSRANARLYDYLRWKYGGAEPIFERNGVTFPLAVYPAPAAQQRDPESVLIQPVSNRFPPDETLLKEPMMRELIQRAGRPAQNLATFAMRELVVGERVRMSCQMGQYFDMIDTCDALEWEILRAAPSLKSSTERAYKLFDNRLPFRKALHGSVANPVRDGACRSVAISLNALIAFYRNDSVYLMLRKRSEQVAVHAGLIHVVPSFMFQPASSAITQEYSLLHSIYREYLEELFDRPDPKPDETDPDYFFGDPHFKELQGMLESGQTEWYFTGVAVNLLNLRPDICTVLLIKDDQWYHRHAPDQAPQDQQFRLNIEFATHLERAETEQALIGNLPLKASDIEMAEYLEVTPKSMTPCGAFALWAGVDLLRSLPEVRMRLK
jgi:hypothetical protein